MANLMMLKCRLSNLIFCDLNPSLAKRGRGDLAEVITEEITKLFKQVVKINPLSRAKIKRFLRSWFFLLVVCRIWHKSRQLQTTSTLAQPRVFVRKYRVE